MANDEIVETPFGSRKTSKFVFWNRTRVYIMFLTLACLTFVQINTAIFTFTVICMNDVMEGNDSTDPHWVERNTEKSMLFSGAAIGGLIGLIPAVPLINTIGLRNVQTICGLTSAFGAFFFPLAVSIGFYPTFLCRVLQGVGSALLFTTVGVVPGVWAPGNEVNTFMAILSCAFQLSSIVCMPVSGLLCESQWGWRSIYYLFGSITLVIYILFWFTYSDDPKLHRNVSQKEFNKIAIGKVEKVKEPVPYLAVCTDPTVLVCWLSCFGVGMGFFLLVLYGPTYLREVLKFDVRETGLLTALPFILSAVSKFIAGQLSDKMTFLSERARIIFFAASSQVGFAAGLIVLAFTSNRLVAQIAFNFSIVFSGLNIIGAVKCLQLRCLQHVHFALVVVSLTAYVGQFLSAIIVSVLCPDNTSEQWRILFLFLAGMIVVCNAAVPFVIKSEAADYTKKADEKC